MLYPYFSIAESRVLILVIMKQTCFTRLKHQSQRNTYIIHVTITPNHSAASTCLTGSSVSSQSEAQVAVAGKGADVVDADLLTPCRTVVTLVAVCMQQNHMDINTSFTASVLLLDLTRTIACFMPPKKESKQKDNIIIIL